MEISLIRTYFPHCTHGEIYREEKLICYSIELAWRKNQRFISCIPEGRYELAKRFSARFGWHIVVEGVPGRSSILFHPANHAQVELKGCIAPVSEITGCGKGLKSKHAFEKLKAIVYPMVKKGKVYLNVESLNPML